MATFISYLLYAKGISDIGYSRLRSLLDIAYNEQLGYGFVDFDKLSSNILSATFIFSVVLRDKVLDITSQQLVTQSRVVFKEARFEIDVDRSVIFVKGSNDRIKKLITILGIITENKVIIEGLHPNIEKAIGLLIENTDGLVVKGVVIKNFRPRPDIFGKFVARLESKAAVDDIMQNYASEISEFTAVLEIDDAAVQLRMANSGAIALRGSDRGIRKVVDLIKDMVKEGSYA